LPTSIVRSTPCLSVIVLGAALAAAPDEYRATREAFLEQINAVRAAAAVRPLRLSIDLSDTAQALAEEAATSGPGAHGSSPAEAARLAAQSGYETRIIGEVVAEADGDIASVVAGWRQSGEPSSGEVISPVYRELGLGVAFRTSRPIYVLLLAISWDDSFHETTDPLKDLEAARERMLARVNRERTSRGLAPLRRHSRLDEAAQSHANDMLARHYYSHDSPEGKTALDRERAKGYRAGEAGENIARGQDSIDEVMDAWMQSKTHREHLLSPLFIDVGFGVAFGRRPGGYEIIWVQDFARPVGRGRT
jgi:uncharacterized protein YkwD